MGVVHQVIYHQVCSNSIQSSCADIATTHKALALNIHLLKHCYSNCSSYLIITISIYLQNFATYLAHHRIIVTEKGDHLAWRKVGITQGVPADFWIL